MLIYKFLSYKNLSNSSIRYKILFYKINLYTFLIKKLLLVQRRNILKLNITFINNKLKLPFIYAILLNRFCLARTLYIKGSFVLLSQNIYFLFKSKTFLGLCYFFKRWVFVVLVIKRYIKYAAKILKYIKNFVILFNRALCRRFFSAFDCFIDIVIRNNTAFVGAKAKNGKASFLTTSTVFGFARYKRYSRFIIEFFLTLCFQFISDFDLKIPIFNIHFNAKFRYSAIKRGLYFTLERFLRWDREFRQQRRRRRYFMYRHRYVNSAFRFKSVGSTISNSLLDPKPHRLVVVFKDAFVIWIFFPFILFCLLSFSRFGTYKQKLMFCCSCYSFFDKFDIAIYISFLFNLVKISFSLLIAFVSFLYIDYRQSKALVNLYSPILNQAPYPWSFVYYKYLIICWNILFISCLHFVLFNFLKKYRRIYVFLNIFEYISRFQFFFCIYEKLYKFKFCLKNKKLKKQNLRVKKICFCKTKLFLTKIIFVIFDSKLFSKRVFKSGIVFSFYKQHFYRFLRTAYRVIFKLSFIYTPTSTIKYKAVISKNYEIDARFSKENNMLHFAIKNVLYMEKHYYKTKYIDIACKFMFFNSKVNVHFNYDLYCYQSINKSYFVKTQYIFDCLTQPKITFSLLYYEIIFWVILEGDYQNFKELEPFSLETQIVGNTEYVLKYRNCVVDIYLEKKFIQIHKNDSENARIYGLYFEYNFRWRYFFYGNTKPLSFFKYYILARIRGIIPKYKFVRTPGFIPGNPRYLRYTYVRFISKRPFGGGCRLPKVRRKKVHRHAFGIKSLNRFKF